MTYSCHKINLFKKIVMLTAVLLIPAAASHADPLSSALQDWLPEYISGKICFLENGSFIVKEEVIIIVDQMVNGKLYRTKVLDIKGNELDQDDLSNGKYVHVRGGVALDNNGEDIIVAKEIVILPHEMTLKELKKKGLNIPPEPW